MLFLSLISLIRYNYCFVLLGFKQLFNIILDIVDRPFLPNITQLFLPIPNPLVVMILLQALKC